MSELKVKKLGKAGYMLCIGADGTDGIWYFMPDAIKKYVDSNIKEGDTVEIKSEKTNKGKDGLTYIAKVGTPGSVSAPAAGQAQQSTEKKPWTPPAKGGFQGHSPADKESIKRQAIGHMTSRVLSGMMTSGIATLEQAEEQAERLYKKFVTLVG